MASYWSGHGCCDDTCGTAGEHCQGKLQPFAPVQVLRSE